jgi:15-cis-phytoene synthase
MTAAMRVAGSTRTLYDTAAEASAAVVIDRYSTSFALACRLLAEPVRTGIRNVYALVRIADEVVDDPTLPLSSSQRGETLTSLEQQTLNALQTGHSANLVAHAFALTARECGIGTELVRPFFDSMRTDLAVTVHDAASLQRYVYGSAEVVGLMCLRVFVADPRATASYDDLAPGAQRLGAAFQKLNFLRDLVADRDVLGRSYLVEQQGTALTDAQRTKVLDEIDGDLAAAARVIPLLPSSSRRGVFAAHALFAALSRRLRLTPADRMHQRVRVPAPVKVSLVAGAVLRSLA